MAANLDTRDNGVKSFVSLRQSAWHQSGSVVADELSYEEALRLGGLDYPLYLRPLTTTVPLFDADGKEHDTLDVKVPNHFSVVRADRQVSLGIVGHRYRIVTAREGTKVVEALVDQGLARIETAGALGNGEDAWMALRFTGDVIDGASENGGDEVHYYGLVRLNHNGSCAVQIATTPIRVVCANTLAMALSNGRTTVRSVRHTGLAGDKVVAQARELWTDVAADAVDIAKGMAALRGHRLSIAQFDRAVYSVLAPEPVLAPNATKRAKALHESALYKVSRDRETLARLWDVGTGQKGALTAWDAFNAATEAMDHLGLAAPTRGAAKLQPLGQQLPGGSLATAKAKVWSNLLALTV